MRGPAGIGVVLLVGLVLVGCGHLILAPWREHQCRRDGGEPSSSYRMFGQYEGTTCNVPDPTVPGGRRAIWHR